MFRQQRVDMYSTTVVSTGCGISTLQIFQTLNRLYAGGVFWDKHIPDLVISGQGPLRFFAVHKFRLVAEEKTDATFGDVHQEMLKFNDALTYEIALLWFLTCPSLHLREFNGPQLDTSQGIVAIPPRPLKRDGSDCALYFVAGTEAPWIWLRPFDTNEPARNNLFLSARWLD